MFLVVFRNRKRADMDVAAYDADADRMATLAAWPCPNGRMKLLHTHGGGRQSILLFNAEGAMPITKVTRCLPVPTFASAILNRRA